MPMSVLAGILIPIGFGVVDYKGLRHLRQVPALDAGLDVFFNLYNYERPHQSLGYAVPADVHFAVKESIL